MPLILDVNSSYLPAITPPPMSPILLNAFHRVKSRHAPIEMDKGKGSALGIKSALVGWL